MSRRSSRAPTSPGSTCSTTVDTGSNVSLTASADTAARFNAWGGDCAPVGGGLQCTFNPITADHDNLTASFVRTFTVTVSKGGPIKFASKNFGEGGTFEVKATKPGVIHYLCTIHPTSMNGAIEVVK